MGNEWTRSNEPPEPPAPISSTLDAGGNTPQSRLRYLCHICGSSRPPEVLPDGEPRCRNCNREGFVEIIEGTQDPTDSNVVILGNGGQEMVNTLIRFMGRPGPPTTYNDLVSNILQQVVTIQSAMEDQQNQGPPPAATSALDELRRKAITIDENSSWLKESCVICQTSYEANDIIATLNEDVQTCQHVFHLDCIVPWLQRHNSCPVCRYELPTDDASYESRREQRNSELLRDRQSRPSMSF